MLLTMVYSSNFSRRHLKLITKQDTCYEEETWKIFIFCPVSLVYFINFICHSLHCRKKEVGIMKKKQTIENAHLRMLRIKKSKQISRIYEGTR
uniref:SJCHGC09708 protein n=1 Tax=Schistosoma japonicum TaxID=6182 RepID=Q5BR31_SCHJA|nr:SJCHGC09708 protein [Schistosoma japonicum]